MDKENDVIDGQEPQQEPAGTPPQLSEVELKAVEAGWKPKTEFDGDEHKWVPADEFLRRGELFGKIDTIGKELRDTKKALQALQAHHKVVKDTEFKRALEQLRSDKKAALEAGDADKLIEIDEQMADAKARQLVEQQITEQAARAPDPRFIAWVNINQWYAQDPEMRTFADGIGTSYSQLHPEKDPSDVLDYVAKKVKAAFSEKFTNPRRTQPSAVEGGGSPPPKKDGEYVLSDEERKVMNTFIRQGIMTKEEYISDLKQIKGEA